MGIDRSEYERLIKKTKGKTFQEVYELLGEERFLEFTRIRLDMERRKKGECK